MCMIILKNNKDYFISDSNLKSKNIALIFSMVAYYSASITVNTLFSQHYL